MPGLEEHVSTKLQEAKYKDAIAFMTSSTTRGGKKIAKKEIANASRQVLEELGVSPRAFRCKFVLAAQQNGLDGTEIRDYFDVRDSFLRALESEEPGDFLHPTFGTVKNCVAMPPWELSEDLTRVGEAELTVTFEITDPEQTTPVVVEHRVSNVKLANVSLQSAVETKLTDEYVIDQRNGGNFVDAVASQEAFTGVTRGILGKVSVSKEKLDGITNALDDYESKIASNLKAPASLASDFSGLMRLFNGAFSGGEIAPGGVLVAVEALTGRDDLFTDTQRLYGAYQGYRTDLTEFPLDTFSRQQRAANRTSFDQSVRLASLGYQYENAVQREYGTVLDIDEAIEGLETEYQDLVPELDVDTQQSLAAVREESLGFFADQKLTARNVTSVRTNPTSTRLLAYQYYGDSSLGELIRTLNGLDDPSLLQGDVNIVTTGSSGSLDAA